MHARRDECDGRGIGAGQNPGQGFDGAEPDQRHVCIAGGPGSSRPICTQGHAVRLRGSGCRGDGTGTGFARSGGSGENTHGAGECQACGPRLRNVHRVDSQGISRGDEQARQSRDVEHRWRAGRSGSARVKRAEDAQHLVRIRTGIARHAGICSRRTRVRALRARLGTRRMAPLPYRPAAFHEAFLGLMASISAAIAASAYPERDEPREGRLDRIIIAARYIGGNIAGKTRPLTRIVQAVNAAATDLESLPAQASGARGVAFRPRLRRDGFTSIALAGEAFALVREAATRAIGLRHFDVQLVGAWAMLGGMLAEMETGEGKTLTATLAAATAALAGRAVHIITVNDYLAERDAGSMRPVYEMLGLTVGYVGQGMDPQARRTAYACDVTYCSNKEIAFDYLRDRMVLGGKPRSIAMKIDALEGAGAGQRLLLRGLQFAIVDEADSVLVDEARTPLILSSEAKNSQEELLHQQALFLAKQLDETDYAIENGSIELTSDGERKLEDLTSSHTGIWRGPHRREQLVRQALTALHVFQRDKHYLVRDGKVQIIDEYTGRLMPDRSWEQGLHQLIELKEGVEVTAQRDTLARISYQRFFRRYVHLCGMTGTASEVAAELWAVYRLRVAKIATHKPMRRARDPDQVYGRSEMKWRAAQGRVEAQQAVERA